MTDAVTRARRARDARAAAEATERAERAAAISRAVDAGTTSLAVGTVTNVVPTGGVGGDPLVTVDLAGASIDAPWLGTVAPSRGDIVVVALYRTEPFIMGRLNGLPPA